jgi:hypothetical protein
MPRRRVMRRRTGRVKRGGSLGSWLRKAGNFIKKHRLISRGAKMYSKRGGPYSGLVGKVGKVADVFGLGLSPTGGSCGGALRLAGGMRRRTGGMRIRRRRR